MNTLPLHLAGVLGLGGPELILIFAVLLLLFGGSKLPELAKGLGKSIKEFKRASQEDDAPAPAATPPAAPAPAPTPVAHADTPAIAGVPTPPAHR